MGLFNPAGGIHYHMTAARNRRLWEPHRLSTAAWLESWGPERDELVLVGPSAGYSLPAGFLEAYGKVTAVDPDPLALGLLRMRFPKVRWRFSAHDFFLGPKRRLNPGSFSELAAAYPEAAFLFCNVLGQLPFVAKDYAERRFDWAHDFAAFQRANEWASFHDLWSARANVPHKAWQPPPLSGENRIRGSVAALGLGGEKIEIRDHQTADLFSVQTDRWLWTWQITKSELHLLEGVRPSKQL
jgi:hypothetical protein